METLENYMIDNYNQTKETFFWCSVNGCYYEVEQMKRKEVLKLVEELEYQNRCFKVKLCFVCGSQLQYTIPTYYCKECDEYRYLN